MAGELQLTVGLRLRKTNLKFDIQTEQQLIDVAGGRKHSTVQDIGTTYEPLTVGDVATAGVAVFCNLDPTNYVEIGLEVSSAFYAFARLLPGEKYPIRLSTLTLFAKAHTAPIKLDYLLIEA